MENTDTNHNLSSIISTYQTIIVDLAAQIFVNQSTLTVEQFLKILIEGSKNISEYLACINHLLNIKMPISSAIKMAEEIVDISKDYSSTSNETEEILKQKQLSLQNYVNKLIEHYKTNPKKDDKD